MKGINVKKIAAFAGAAVLFGAAAVAAEVTYGSTQLVDQSGQPTVKIYVGSKAMVSDGVAAANIAAKIANEAYKSSTLTASVSGTPTCQVGASAGTGGAGACSIVESSKKVTLTVTLPGSVAGTYQFKTLITDTIDRTLQNRNNTLSEDNYSATLTAADTAGSITSPIRGPETDTTKGRNLYRIGASQFSGFADYAMSDQQAVGGTYTEEQSFWIGSQPNAVQYDSSSSIRDIAVNKLSAMAYSLKFTGNDYGIPVCTGDLATNDTTNWASCDTDSNSRTDRHRLKLNFMGSEWIVSEMTNPAGNLNSSTAVTAGGQIKLAKEAKYGIINVGGVIDAGAFKIRLSDISVAVGAGNTHPAILDILDANEAVIGQVQVDPGTTYTFTQSGTTNIVKIHVYKTAPGFTLNAKWAEMAVYTDEITLKDAGRYNLVSSTDTDKDYKVSLLWKNKDWTGASTDSPVIDSLREIVVYNTDGFDAKTLPGDVINFLKSTPTFKLSYDGLDLQDSEYVPLTYSAMSSDTYRVSATSGDQPCGASSSADLQYTAKWIEIKSSGNQFLGGTGDALSGDYQFEKVYYDPIGNSNDSTFANSGGAVRALNGTTQNQSIWYANYSPKVFYKISGRDCYNWDNVPLVATGAETLVTNGIRFDKAGDNSAAQGMVFFSNETGLATGFGMNIVLKEDAGKKGTASNNAVYVAVPTIINNNTYSTMRFRNSDSSTQQVYYKGLGIVGAAGYSNYEPTLVTERGSKVTDVGTSDATLSVASRIGMPSFTFAYADTSVATSGQDYIMGVGDSQVFGGVTVKVKAIDANAGSCTMGAAGTSQCTVDPVNAVISPNNAASVQVSEPYALSSNLVALDTDGAGAGVAIVVGGPAVNTMAADLVSQSSIDFNTNNVVVQEIGNKILVAGLTAQDTMSAADQFIAGVRRQ